MQHIGIARNTDDAEQALVLATKIFRSEDPFEAALATTKFLMSAGKDLCREDVIVLVDENNQIVGACFLIDRHFFRGSETIQGTFLSSICIAKNHRGKGFSEMLMKFSIAECERRGSFFAILIARRAVDHFYTKFNFWGISQYSKVNLSLKKEQPTSDLSVISATMDDLPEIGRLYESNYSSLLGSCVRTTEQWEHILLKAKRQNLEFVTVKKDATLLGYAILNRTEIEEFASSKDVSKLELLRHVMTTHSLTNLTINCAPNHPLVSELAPLDFSITLRQCIYGGHMVRIINPEALLSEAIPEYAWQVSVNRSEGLSIPIDQSALQTDSRRHQFSYKETCEVMGASFLSAGDHSGSGSLLRSFNVPFVDRV